MSRPRPAARAALPLAIALSALLWPAGAATQDAPAVTGIAAVHRDGQTFVTWKDVAPGNEGAGYRYALFRSAAPITEETLSHARAVQSGLLNHSGQLFGHAFTPADRVAPGKPMARLAEGEAPLPPWSGLAVHTAAQEEAAFYAVAAYRAGSGSRATKIIPGESATTTAVQERPAALEPIKIHDSRARGQGSAPTVISGRPGLPIVVYLHGSQAQGGPVGELGDAYLYFGSREMGFRDGVPGVFSVEERAAGTGGVLLVRPRDAIVRPDGREALETYWFGYGSVPQGASHKDLRAYPFTERRLQWIIEWVVRRYRADGTRVSLAGNSMGGWGGMTFGLRSPDLLSGIFVTLPRTRQRALPAFPEPPRGAQGVQMADGSGSYLERMDMVRFVAGHPGDLPFVAWAIGRRDEFASWREQVDMARALAAGRHGFVFAWNNGDHSAGAKPMELIEKTYDRGAYRRDSSYPAFTNSSIDSDMGNGTSGSGDPEGGINLGFTWREPIDRPDQWSVRVGNALAKSAMTVDVTPRRLRSLAPRGGETLSWKSSSGGSGTVTVGEDRLVTIPRVVIEPGRDTRLTISRP